jgi:alpha-L-fucosidase
MREQLDVTFSDDLATDGEVEWVSRTPVTATGTLTFAREQEVGIVDLREDIWQGQRVARYTVEGMVGGAWRELSSGTTVGYRKLDRIAPARVRALRVNILDAVEPPLSLDVGAYGPG